MILTRQWGAQVPNDLSLYTFRLNAKSLIPLYTGEVMERGEDGGNVNQTEIVR